MIETLENRTLLSGAAVLEGQLLIARQQALRDSAVYGVRYEETIQSAATQPGTGTQLGDGSVRFISDSVAGSVWF